MERSRTHEPQYASSLLEASPDPLLVIDDNGRITDINEASIRITGFSRQELNGSNFLDYFTDPINACAVYKEGFSKGFVVDSQLTLRNKSGQLIDVLFNGSIYKDISGKVAGIVIAARDITAQKLLSSYSLSLIEANRDPLFTINALGKITDMNNVSVKITGVSRVKMIGSDFYEYFTEPEKAKEGYQHIFENGSVEDFPLTMKDKGLTDVLFNGSVYKDERGIVIGAVVVARVITEQKRIEKELTESMQFAEQARMNAEDAKIKAESATQIAENAMKAKQQFLSNMSHEIRTPMNAIIGFTKVLLKTDLSAKQKEYLTAIKMSGDSLIVLINDILDLAKVDSGKMTFEKTPFKMETSISAMLNLFETKIQEKNLSLIKEYDSKIPRTLLGDPARLHQIILNLVSNAVKFTSSGTIKMSTRLLSEDAENATIEFSISDTGIGITNIKLDKIFENFQQASSVTSRLYGGTGLGLAIVKKLVESQGGVINVKSKIDVGSTFSFVLTFQKTTSEVENIIENIEVNKDLNNISVLVVEDIALNQLLMKTLLDDFGFKRDIAANGKIAIEKLKVQSYDIVLMDLQMPEMNGFDATAYIRNTLHLTVPIIALTADVTTVDLAKCKSVGMNDYIAKPVDERLLYSKIIEYVNQSETKNQTNISKKEEIKFTKCVNLGYLMDRTKSDRNLMMEMISIYLKQTPPLIQTMKQSLHSQDWDSLYSSAHKIIPSFAIMGMSVDFENMAKNIQEHASLQKESEDIAEMVFKIENICSQACKELEEEYSRLQNSEK